MEIAYRAHTETCTLLLDSNGICRSIQAISSMFNGRTPRIPSSAERCIGAQYVASLDLREVGILAQLPEPGAQLLFARIEIDGRITLVRSAPLVRFEHMTGGTSGVHERDDLDYDGDDARTEPSLDLEDPTIPRRMSYPPSYPPYPPPRESMQVPAQRAARGSVLPRVSIPPLPPPPANLRASAPPASRDSGPTLPRRPSVSRASSSVNEGPTLPFRRVAR